MSWRASRCRGGSKGHGSCGETRLGGKTRGMDTRRHAPLGRRRVPVPQRVAPPGAMAIAGRSRPPADDLISATMPTPPERAFPLAAEHLPGRRGRRAGHSGRDRRLDGSRRKPEAASCRRSRPPARRPAGAPCACPSARVDGLRWAVPKTDRLLIPSGAMATKFVILDRIRQRRGNRDYIMNKPYARWWRAWRPCRRPRPEGPAVQSLQALRQHRPRSTRPTDARMARRMPPSSSSSFGRHPARTRTARSSTSQEVDRPGGAASGAPTRRRPACCRLRERQSRRRTPGRALGAGASRGPAAQHHRPAENRVRDGRHRRRPRRARGARPSRRRRGDTLARVLARLGAEPWQARAMHRCGRTIFADTAMLPGLRGARHVGAIGHARPIAASRCASACSTRAHDHKVTVTRNAAGEYVASATPIDERVAEPPSSRRSAAGLQPLREPALHRRAGRACPPT